MGLGGASRLALRCHLHVDGRPEQPLLALDFGTGNWWWRGKKSEETAKAVTCSGTEPTPSDLMTWGLVDSPMAWSCDVPLWLWLDSALDEAVAMSYTTVGENLEDINTEGPTNQRAAGQEMLRSHIGDTSHIFPI